MPLYDDMKNLEKSFNKEQRENGIFGISLRSLEERIGYLLDTDTYQSHPIVQQYRTTQTYALKTTIDALISRRRPSLLFHKKERQTYNRDVSVVAKILQRADDLNVSSIGGYLCGGLFASLFGGGACNVALIPLHHLRDTTYGTGSLITSIVFGGLFAVLYYVTSTHPLPSGSLSEETSYMDKNIRAAFHLRASSSSTAPWRLWPLHSAFPSAEQAPPLSSPSTNPIPPNPPSHSPPVIPPKPVPTRDRLPSATHGGNNQQPQRKKDDSTEQLSDTARRAMMIEID